MRCSHYDHLRSFLSSFECLPVWDYILDIWSKHCLDNTQEAGVEWQWFHILFILKNAKTSVKSNLNGWHFTKHSSEFDSFTLNRVCGDTASVLFLLEFAVKAYGVVFALALRASCSFVPDIHSIYESDLRTCGCACLSYFRSQVKGMFKTLFVVFIAAKYCLWLDLVDDFNFFIIISQYWTGY